MKKLKKILRYSVFFFFFFSLINLGIVHLKKDKSILNDADTSFKGKIVEIKKVNGGYSFVFDVGERLGGNYFKENLNFSLGDIVLIEGSLSLPKDNTVPNLFSYRNYLKYKKQYYVVEIESIKLLQNNTSVFYKIKNEIVDYLSKFKSSAYLKLFLLGDNNELAEDVTTSFQKNGISHLFAVSGMHVSLMSSILLFFLSKILSENKSKILIFVFLFFYMFLTGMSSSIVRTVIFSFILFLNKLFNLELKVLDCFILMVSILLFLNPFYIYQISFQYSVFISFTLILFQKSILNYSYFKSLIFVSFLSFLSSLPITIFHFFEINFLSIIWNLIFVPFVSFIVFPFSLVVSILPILDSYFIYITGCLEKLSLFLQTFDFFILSFKKPSYLWIIFYYIFFFLFFCSNKKRYFLVLFILIIELYFYNFLFPGSYLFVIDVGQGDSILLHSNNETILLDTGGKASFNGNSNLSDDIHLPLLKSLGIHNIDSLVISHGDSDHMGEAINLVENFKVEKVIFNCGEYNDLEKELIKVLDKKKISYYSCIEELNIDDNKLYFLNNKDYGNENDNSSVIYTKMNNYKFLFMGDAGEEVEEDLIERYNLQDIDVLKVGHHGSKTSSSLEFINEINPKYSIISVGKNNRYGHPNDSVLGNLNNSKIYRTDQDGSIMFKIKNNKLEIETCSP